MRDEHEQITIMEEKSRKLMELIKDKKTNGDGPKKLTDQDVEDINDHIKELKGELKKTDKEVKGSEKQHTE